LSTAEISGTAAKKTPSSELPSEENERGSAAFA